MSANSFNKAVGCGMACVLGLLANGLASAQDLKRGQEFPEFSEPDMRTGKTVDLKDFRGKVVLIDFWATWCGPCKAELPNVKKAYEKHHKDGFEIISVSLDQTVDACKTYVEQNKMDWYHICDGKFWEAKLAKKHGVHGIPYAVVIGRDGKVLTTEARGAGLNQAIEEGLKQTGEPEKDDEVDEQAQKELSQAETLRKARRYAEALKVYDQVGVKYAARKAGKTANERARELREDPTILKLVQQAEQDAKDAAAAEEGGKWLKTAREMAKAQDYDLARKYYRKITDKYPGTKLAKTAEEELKKLPE